MLPDLSTIAKTIIWSHRNIQHKDSAGIFAVVPKEIAKQFPFEAREKEDASPSHLTILYLGALPRIAERKLLYIVNEVCENTRPFVVSLKKPRKFVNDKGQTILHSPVKSGRLVRFHDRLHSALLNAGIQVDNKFPEYKPHITIGYVNSRKELKQLKEIRPEGQWIMDSIWIWGLANKEPHLVFLGK